MKVHLFKHRTIADYVKEHAAGKAAFGAWLNGLKYADWKDPQDIV